MQTLSFFNRLCLADICFVHNYIAFPENYPMHNTGRRHHGFLYTLQGTETYHFADKTVAAVPHSVLYIPKNEEYTIVKTGTKYGISLYDHIAMDGSGVNEGEFLN